MLLCTNLLSQHAPTVVLLVQPFFGSILFTGEDTQALLWYFILLSPMNYVHLSHHGQGFFFSAGISEIPAKTGFAGCHPENKYRTKFSGIQIIWSNVKSLDQF
jgi:hypothetical protein